MSQELNRQEQFILKEYEEASRLTYHIDQLRNSLTGFFLTFTGVAGAGLAILVKGEAAGDTPYFSEGVISGLLTLVAALGATIGFIFGSQSRLQSEHGLRQCRRTHESPKRLLGYSPDVRKKRRAPFTLPTLELKTELY